MCKKIGGWALALAGLQAARILLVQGVFLLTEHTVQRDVWANLLYMLAVSALLLAGARHKKYPVPWLPQTFSRRESLALLAVLLTLAPPMIAGAREPGRLLFLAYGAIVTPLFEEILFRGLVWQAFAGQGRRAWGITALLFGAWHAGYVPTLVWRVTQLQGGANIPSMLFWKVLTGLAFGILLGAVRHRAKNVFAPFLLHCFLNALQT